MLGLVRASFDERNTVTSELFWRWKHEQNPAGPSALEVADDESGIVSLRAFMRWRFFVGDRAVDAVRAVDTVTHPRARGLGHFKRLTLSLASRLEREGVSFVYNTPNSQSLPGYLKMGWVKVTRVPLWILPRRPLTMLAAARAPRPGGGLKPIEIESFATAAAGISPHLFQAILGQRRLHTSPSTEQWAWRYGAVPDIRYGVVNRQDAVVIARCRRRRGLRELSIAELLVGPGFRGFRDGVDAIRELLSTVPSDHALAIAAPFTSAAAVLAASGFIYIPHSGPLLTVRGLAGPAPSRWQDWAPSLGDLELF